MKRTLLSVQNTLIPESVYTVESCKPPLFSLAAVPALKWVGLYYILKYNLSYLISIYTRGTDIQFFEMSVPKDCLLQINNVRI